MQMFVKKFSVDSERIIIADKSHYDVQYLLKKCSTLITDYSSIFMDVVYIQKPVLFYQYKKKKFRQGQYNSGYFDYHNNQYSLWADTEKDLLYNLEILLSNPKTINYHITDLFPLYDTNNCKRVYESISQFDK